MQSRLPPIAAPTHRTFDILRARHSNESRIGALRRGAGVSPLLLLLLLPLALACGQSSDSARAPTPRPTDDAEHAETSCRSALPPGTRRFLDERQGRYEEARRRARSWLDALSVDHLELRRHGIKGKKKVVEHLDAYAWLLRDPLGERAELERRFAEVAALTRDPSFHDMAALDERQFKQDATSYLRAAFLMDLRGLDTSWYVDEIREVLPLYDARMSSRGGTARMLFHIYYEHFGFEEPFPLAASYETGMISSRPDPRTMKRMAAYRLTHEIFMAFRYGEVRESDFFDDDDLDYLAGALPVLLRASISAEDPDLAGELLLCVEYLDLVQDPAYREGITYLLDCQNDDGSWGDYPDAEREYGPLADYHVYLHTTKVALSGLVNAFRCPE